MKTADFVFKHLADLGVRNVFMVSGGGAMFLNDALGKEQRIRYVCNHHEQASAIAAEGYFRATDKLAVVSVTTGPGGTNSLTGVIGQWLDSIPVLYISGQVKFETTIASCPEFPLRQLGDQEINIVDIVKPVTKYAVMVTRSEDIRYEIEKAIHIATSGRKGPVWLDIPINVQSTEIAENTLRGYDPESSAQNEITDETINEIVEAFVKAKSPVIIAGHGVRLAKAEAVFEKLLQLCPCPVLATFCGFDLLPSSHPCSAGRIGTIGTRSGNIALQNADFILCLGSRNNIRQISYNWENFAKKATAFVAVDTDAAELKKKTVKITHPVQADIAEFLPKFIAALGVRTLPDWTHWLSWTIERRDKYSAVLPEYHTVSGGVQPYVFTEELTRQLPENAVVACTNATPSVALFQAGIIKSRQRLFANSGCAAMGYGLPAALGAIAANPKRPVICLEGDGSLMMNLQELHTIVHHQFPLKLFLYNNGEYCSIRQTQDNFFEKRHTGCDDDSGVSFPDWEKIAKAFDWKYVRIDTQCDLGAQIENVLNFAGCVFCDVRLVKGYTFSPKLSSKRLPDGQLVSPSLEDMFPFLPEEEQRANIYHAER